MHDTSKGDPVANNTKLARRPLISIDLSSIDSALRHYISKVRQPPLFEETTSMVFGRRQSRKAVSNNSENVRPCPVLSGGCLVI